MHTVCEWWRRRIIRTVILLVVIIYFAVMTGLGVDVWTTLLIAAAALYVGVKADQWVLSEQ